MATAAQLVPSLGSLDRGVAAWVDEVARLTQPDRIHWCDGSEAEYQSLERELVAKKDLLPLNPASFPGCHLHRSHPSDVARVEHLTFVCTQEPRRRGPQQPLDGARRGARQDGCAVRRLHEGTHDVRGALLHGTDRLAVLALRRRDHRQRLRGAQHGPHDSHGPSRARAHRARRQVREGLALHRRARPQSALHHAFSRGAVDQELRLGIRRQRPARQEMPRAAHRQLAGAR